MKILVFLIIFLLVGAFFIISENHLALKNAENRKKFQDLYIVWVNKIFDNSKTTAGYVVKLDWLPGEE